MSDPEPEQQPNREAGPASLLGLGLESGRQDWPESELAAALEQELSSPLNLDVSNLPSDERCLIEGQSGSPGRLPQSLGELLGHPAPSLAALMLVKDYAKAQLQLPDAILPPAVAAVVYHACIAAAHQRHDRHLSGLKPAALQAGYEWVLQQTWIDDGIRTLVAETARTLKAPEPHQDHGAD